MHDVTGILGVDPSLTCTALVHRHDVRPGCQSFTISPEPLRGPARLDYLLDGLRRALVLTSPDLVVLEGYAFAARGRHHATAEWGGLLRWELYRCRIPYIVVPPTTLKLYAAGKGNTPDLVAAVRKRWRYRTSSHDVADAYALMRLGVELTTRVAKPTTDFARIATACELYSTVPQMLRAETKIGLLESPRKSRAK